MACGIDICFGDPDSIADFTTGYVMRHTSAGEKVLFACFSGKNCADMLSGRVRCLATRTLLRDPASADDEEKHIALADNTDLFDDVVRLTGSGEYSLAVLYGVNDAIAFDTLYEGIETDLLRGSGGRTQLLLTGGSVSAQVAYYADRLIHLGLVRPE